KQRGEGRSVRAEPARQQPPERETERGHQQHGGEQRSADRKHRHFGEIGARKRLDQQRGKHHIVKYLLEADPVRIVPDQPAAQQKAGYDQQKDRDQRGDDGAHGAAVGESRARRSSAPWRMKAAACWSITSARRARLISASIRPRSTAAVESRSSQSPI